MTLNGSNYNKDIANTSDDIFVDPNTTNEHIEADITLIEFIFQIFMFNDR